MTSKVFARCAKGMGRDDAEQTYVVRWKHVPGRCFFWIQSLGFMGPG